MLKQTVFEFLKTENITAVGREIGISAASVYEWGPVVPFRSARKFQDKYPELTIDYDCYDVNMVAIRDKNLLRDKGLIV